MRNATCTTIAPTGSISILAGCSSGIEPIFAAAARRRVLGKEFIEVHPLVAKLGQRQGWLTPRVRTALLSGTPPREIPEFPRQLAELLVTAHEIAPEWHVKVQAAFQGHIDNAVSKTVNLPSHATVADVDRIFRLAYELGCKGITVYREGSYSEQTFTAAKGPRRVAGGATKKAAWDHCATLTGTAGLSDGACPMCERCPANGPEVAKNNVAFGNGGREGETKNPHSANIQRQQPLHGPLKSPMDRT